MGDRDSPALSPRPDRTRAYEVARGTVFGLWATFGLWWLLF